MCWRFSGPARRTQQRSLCIRWLCCVVLMAVVVLLLLLSSRCGGGGGGIARR
jgi:hypothetical protein